MKFTRKMICFFCTWTEPHVARGSHGALLRAHQEVNHLPQWGWIEQSDAHITQTTVQTGRQLLGKTSYVSEWDWGRDRDGKGRNLLVVAVMLSETLPQCCVLLLCISHCWRPSLSAQSSVSSETSDLSVGMPERKFRPEAGSDGWTDTLAFHCDYLHHAFKPGQPRETALSGK